jgi:two-component system CheB/CheR fusion protein
MATKSPGPRRKRATLTSAKQESISADERPEPGETAYSEAAVPESPEATSGQTARPEEDAPVKAAPAVTAKPEAITAPAQPFFPIVGIGASAGGLEALEAFLKATPADAGMAFVVVSHLDPTRKGIMVALLQRSTPMPVIEVKDGTRVEPGRVYLIPPNKDMSILHGILQLFPQKALHGVRLPIDFFFRSLAEDQRDRSIGVLLSGMGSDGTLGFRAIKEHAGAGFVQAPSSAKFDGMPRSAIDAGLADVVAPVEELPGKLIAYVRHSLQIVRPPGLEEKSHSALEKIFVLLRNQTGNDFSSYKRSTIYRRIERRMGLHQIDRIGNYVDYLRGNREEIEQLFKELLIGVTSFFRDAEVWGYLGEEVLPKFLAERGRKTLRVWVAGCSTGEEAYSLAIVLKEALARIKPPHQPMIQIFATDLDTEAIERARVGIYPDSIAADVSEERLSRYFLRDERGFRVGKEIRESIVFAPQNVITDPPFTKLDIISCRNLLIYLANDVQKRLIALFHYSLTAGGLLILGLAETVGPGGSELFAPLASKMRIYRRMEAPLGHEVEFPSRSPSLSPSVEAPADLTSDPGASPAASRAPYAIPNLQMLVERTLVQRFSPAAVLTNDKGAVLYFGGRTGKYLEPAPGNANLNLLAMAREGLRHELAQAFNTALREGRRVTVEAVSVKTNGDRQLVNLTVEKLTRPEALSGNVIVAFTDVPARPQATGKRYSNRRIHEDRIIELEQQLRHAQEENKELSEEMQTSQEELKSTNEELQSTNEELQSTNEELTTSKEELQALNEELQTVNQELQSKIDELSRNNNDMKNLLNSTDIATLFLDDQLNVRRFTNETAKIIKLIPADTGRPITDINTELDYPDLVNDARNVLRELVSFEKVVPARTGRWYTVRIMPYRTLENVIDGVVITFTDVTSAKISEAMLREQANQLRQMAESLPILIWGARPDGSWDYLSRQWLEYTGVAESEQLGYAWLEQVHPEDRKEVDEVWKSRVLDQTQLDIEFRLRSASGNFRWFKTRAVPIRSERGALLRWYGSSTDIDNVKRLAVPDAAADARE